MIIPNAYTLPHGLGQLPEKAQSGSCTERENLAGDLKRGNARGAKGVGHRL
jgi:hypothetical protein